MTGQISVDGTPMPLSKERYLIGRGDGCDILLPEADMAVSRRHAMLERNALGEWQLLDISSRNGTLVNNQRVADRYTLQDGDVIRIGGSELNLTLPRNMPTVFMPAPTFPVETSREASANYDLPANSETGSSGDLPGYASVSGNAVKVPISPPAISINEARTNLNDEAAHASNASFFADRPSVTPACDQPRPLPTPAIAAETFPRPSVAEPMLPHPIISPPAPAVPEMSSARPATVQTSAASTPAPQEAARSNINANMPGPAPVSGAARVASKSGSAMGGVIGLGLAGALVGNFGGFMLRPSILGMQMPLMDVLTLGSNLHGMFFVDVKGLCITSFCYLVGGGLLGAAIGALSALALFNLMRNSAKANAS